MEENKEFLQGYEIKNWDFSSRIYKIIASAAIFNLLFLVVIGQTDLLQAKACNAPLINKVCSVLDTVYVGSKFLGEGEWDVREYNKTEIKDADVVWVDNTGVTPQLQYPSGYFQVANRDELASYESFDSQYGETLPPFDSSPLPPITPSSPPPLPPLPPISRRNNSIFNKKPVLPKRNKNVVDGDLPDSPFGDADKDSENKDKIAADKKADEEKDKTKKDLEENTAKTSDSVKDVGINKKPLEDFTDDIVTRWSKKEIDLTKNFAVKINAILTDEGTFDKNKTRFTSEQGDEDIVNVAKSAIEAIGDSGFLAYLKNLDVRQVEMSLVQDGEKLYLVVVSAQKTPEQAKTKASGLRNLISISKLAVKTEDEKTLLNSAKVTSEGNNFLINVNIPKPIANEMINRNLQEALSKRKTKEQQNGTSPKQPNSMTESKITNNPMSK